MKIIIEYGGNKKAVCFVDNSIAEAFKNGATLEILASLEKKIFSVKRKDENADNIG